MSQKSERKKQVKAKKRAAVAQAAAARAATNSTTDDLRYVTFGVARIDGKDHIIRVGDYDSPQHLIRDSEEYMDKQHAEFLALLKSSTQQLQAAKATGKIDNDTPYMNFICLCENGRALAKASFDDAKTDFEQWFEKTTDEFKKRLETNYYDQEFPEHAAEAKTFVQKIVREIGAEAHVPVQMPEGGVINPEYLTSTIHAYLEQAKQEITETGKAKGMIGWGTEDGLFLYSAGFPTSKYRFGRAVSEVAAIINAPCIIYGGEMWLRDPKTFKRTGEEAVSAFIVSPDGHTVADGNMMFYRNPWKFSEPQITVHESSLPEQFLFPKWAYFSTPATVAA